MRPNKKIWLQLLWNQMLLTNLFVDVQFMYKVCKWLTYLCLIVKKKERKKGKKGGGEELAF